MKRWRHLPTVGMLQPRRSAIALLLSPAAAHSTSLARATIAWGRLREAATAGSCACSSALSTSSALGRPIGIGSSPQAEKMPFIQARFMQTNYGTRH
jgi:hypothetical protein